LYTGKNRSSFIITEADGCHSFFFILYNSTTTSKERKGKARRALTADNIIFKEQ